MAYCCDADCEGFDGTEVASREEGGDGRWFRCVGRREWGDEMGEEENLECRLKDIDCVVEVMVVIGRLVA
jgi:hypothetical protein